MGWKEEKHVLKVCLGVLLYLEQCRASMLRVYVLASPHSLFLPSCMPQKSWHSGAVDLFLEQP